MLTGISSNSGVSLGAGNGGASSLKRGTDDARGSASSGEVAIVSAGDVDSGAAVEGVSWSKGSQRRVDLYIQIVLGLINQHAVEGSIGFGKGHCFINILRSIFAVNVKRISDACSYQAIFHVDQMHLYIYSGSIFQRLMASMKTMFQICSPQPIHVLFPLALRGLPFATKVLHSQVSWIYLCWHICFELTCGLIIYSEHIYIYRDLGLTDLSHVTSSK